MDEKIDQKEHKARQIVHEAEVTRQHARYKIPATIEIYGNRYALDDWSVSGCAIEDLLPEIHQQKNAIGKIIFTFDNFETVVDNLHLEFLEEKKGNITGCRFTDLTPQQLSILNEIIASYLEGDILTEGDIIHAATTPITYEKKEEKKVDKKKLSIILILIYVIVAILTLFLFYVTYKRVYVVQTLNGYVDANLTVIRAPAPTYIYYPTKHYVGERINKGDMLLTAYLVAGGVQKIASPLSGKIYQISALNGEFRNVAEQILYILPNTDNSIYITTHIDHKNLIKVKVGDIATVVTPNKVKFYAKITKIIPAHTVLQEKSKHLLENIYNKARDYDTIVLTTNYQLTRNMINQSLFITIDTFLNRWGLLSLDDNDIKVIKPQDNSYQNMQKNNNYNNRELSPKEQKVDYSNYGNQNGNSKIFNESQRENSDKYIIKKTVKNQYCIIVKTLFKLKTNEIVKFSKVFPNGEVTKYKNLYELKLNGFTSYNQAKRFIKRHVIKYYEDPFIVKCGNKNEN